MDVYSMIEAYKESLKADLEDAIEKQEQEQMEEYNQGREDALKYALQMLDKHLVYEWEKIERT